MSPPDKIDPVKAWLAVEKLLDEEGDRVASLGDEEVERELASVPAPARVPSVADLVARGEARAHDRARERGASVPLPPRKGAPWAIWLVAAALGAVILAVALEHRELSAWLAPRPEPIAPEPPREQRERNATSLEKAVKLREAALASCARGEWSDCVRKLDDARALDPAGDSAPGVQQARRAADAAMHPEPEHAPKPK